MNSPGRACPLHYRYAPSIFARPVELHADTLLIAGGLYGNLAALHVLNRLLEPEATLVFNGDFNWFNIDPAGFSSVNAQALQHIALRGNVETELHAGDSGAGCGCAYPGDVDDAQVERSNAIMSRLHAVSSRSPRLANQLGALPMHLVAQVGDKRIAIVHGDAHSLSGWEFGHDALHDADNTNSLASLFVQAGVHVFASSHTCLPALRKLQGADQTFAVINNGAAGMPNFAGTHFGVATRISIRPCPRTVRVYGTRIGNVFVDAIKLHYDHINFVDQFLSNWPSGSPGHKSYYSRIINGPAFSPEMALGILPEQRIRRLAW